jgi:hypothetical protein
MPLTFNDLQVEINAFAAKNNATPDVFFEVWFNYIHHRMTAFPDRQYLMMEPLKTRPSQCVLKAAANPEFCEFSFHDNSQTLGGAFAMFTPQRVNQNYQFMIALFVTLMQNPNFRLSYVMAPNNELEEVYNSLF